MIYLNKYKTNTQGDEYYIWNYLNNNELMSDVKMFNFQYMMIENYSPPITGEYRG